MICREWHDILPLLGFRQSVTWPVPVGAGFFALLGPGRFASHRVAEQPRAKSGWHIKSPALDSACIAPLHKRYVEACCRFRPPRPRFVLVRARMSCGNRKGREVITLKQGPTFEISESKDRGYLVLVTWSEGSEQQVDGFASVEAARAWIENDGPNWSAGSSYSH